MKKAINVLNRENFESDDYRGVSKDDFGDMLSKLEAFNDSFPYYKTMIKRDQD